MSSFQVDRADLVFDAVTGQASRDIQQLRRDFRTAVAGMSDDTLRLANAQGALDRALSKHGPESAAARRAELQLRREIESSTGSLRRQERAVESDARSLTVLGRSATGAGAGLSRLRSSAFIAASGFIGAGGLAYGIRSAIDASSDLHEQTTKTQAVFGSASRAVLDFADNALGQAKDQALDAASSIGALLRPVGVAEKDAARVSVTLTKLGTDLASFYNSSVADALTAIRSGLVGESEPMRRYGTQLSEARVKTMALAMAGKENEKQLTNQDKVLARVAIILKDTSIAQGDYARTIDGTANQEREWQKNLRDTEAAIGDTLTPAYRELLHSVNAYLGDADNQRKIQEKVNDAVETGTEIVEGLAAGIDGVRAVLGPVVDGLGGVQQATELAFGAALVLKVRKAAGSMGLIGTSSALVSRAGVAEASAFGRAWDLATRPRSMVVTTTYAGGGTAGGPAGVPIPAGGGRPPVTGKAPKTVVGRIGQYGAPIAVAGGAAAIAGGLSGFVLGSYTLGLSGEQKEGTLAYDPSTDTFAFVHPDGQRGDTVPDDLARKYDPALYAKAQRFRQSKRKAPGRTYQFGFDAFVAGAKATAGQTPSAPNAGASNSGTTPPPAPSRTQQDYHLDLARAGTDQERMRVLRRHDSYLDRAIAQLEADKTLTAKQKQRLIDLYSERDRTDADIQSIIDKREAAAQKAAADAEAKRKKAAAAAAAKRRQDAVETARMVKATEDALFTGTGPYANTSKGFTRYGVDPKNLPAIDKKNASASDTDQLRQELGSMFRDFMQWQIDLAKDGSNVRGGSLGTAVLEQLTREQTGVIRTAFTGPRRPDRTPDETIMAW